MSQPLRPNADNSAGGWSSTPLFRKIDELSASDVDYVTSGVSAGDKFEVQLTQPALPEDGPHVLKVRLRKTDSGVMRAVIRLMQGTKIIAVRVVQPTQSFAEQSISLTPAEVQAITDYSNLRVQVQANIDDIDTCSECPGGAPSSWLVAFPNMTGDCTGCDALNPVTLNYQSGCTWRGTVTLCGNPVTIELTHENDGYWHLNVLDGEYTLIDSAWECLGVNLMSDYYGIFSLCDWPDSVVVSPA